MKAIIKMESNRMAKMKQQNELMNPMQLKALKSGIPEFYHG